MLRMIKLHAVDWFTIVGRGLVAAIDTPYDEPSNLKNALVDIDGEIYRVRDVEQFHPRRPTDAFGLLVRKYDAERDRRTTIREDHS